MYDVFEPLDKKPFIIELKDNFSSKRSNNAIPL